MRFALDETVSHWLAGLLRTDGYDADSAKEPRRLGFHDPQVLAAAAAARRTLVTHNINDFEAIHEAWIMWRRRSESQLARDAVVTFSLSGHAGIIVLPHGTPRMLANLLEPFADSHANIDDRPFVWSISRGWYEVTF